MGGGSSKGRGESSTHVTLLDQDEATETVTLGESCCQPSLISEVWDGGQNLSADVPGDSDPFCYLFFQFSPFIVLFFYVI